MSRRGARLAAVDFFNCEVARALGQALDEQHQADRDVTVRVGVLLGLGEAPGQIPGMLGVPAGEVVAAVARIRRVGPRIEALERRASIGSSGCTASPEVPRTRTFA
jgi:hypothetical protein